MEREGKESTMSLIDHPTGNYQFLPIATAPRIVGAAPFSSGVRALPGYEIAHATFQRPLPSRAGFAAAAHHLAAIGRPRTALCAVEVRVPRPLTMDEFTAFNADYRTLLGEWGVLVDGQVPIARSNVAPLGVPPSEILLYAFSYTVPTRESGPTFFLSAAPEKADVRPGETTPDALREKAASAMQAMQSGLAALEMEWSAVTALGIYTHHDVHTFLDTEIIAAMGAAAIHGIHWYYGPPPIVGLEIEIDVRSIRQDLRLS
jgi:hypothetical protein